MIYIALTITWKKEAAVDADVIIAQLSDASFEGFIQEDTQVVAYIDKEKFSNTLLQNCDFYPFVSKYLTIRVEEIGETNWNEVWESNFEAVQINNCMVRAPFHTKTDAIKYDIVIEPKMSFGTGHHETTSLVIEAMLQHDFSNKSVLDMGCGTGVLAILAHKLNALEIDAIDNDIWSYENTLENIDRNNAQKIKVYHGDINICSKNKYDVVIANITRNILLEMLPFFADMQQVGGILIMSGFYKEDVEKLEKTAEKLNYVLKNKIFKNNWASIELYKR